MKNQIRSTVEKPIIILTLTASLFLNSVLPIFACGMIPIVPVFSFDLRPDNDLKQFAGGDLGILKPNYARSYLVVAYRLLNGYSLSPAEQEQMVKLWNHRLSSYNYIGNAEESENDDEFESVTSRNEREMKTALKNWFDARGKIVNDETKVLSINDLWKDTSDEFSFYLNCTKSGFETAANTLEKRSKEFGKDSESLKEWVSGQDAVFSNCSGKGTLPVMLEKENPEWLVKDRDYQIAAALFYAERFEEARKQFEKISIDNDSEWKGISAYLVARTYLREFSLGKNNSTELIKRAEAVLTGILENENDKDIQRAARELLYSVANSSKTPERFHKFSQLLSNGAEIEDIYNEVDTYTSYLDSMGFKDEVPQNSEQKQEKPKKISELTFWEWLWNWLFGTAEKKEHKIDPPVKTTAVYRPVYRYDKEVEKLKNFLHFSSDQKFENISDTAHQSDISDWIMTFQASDKSGFQHALDRWRKTSKVHWFLAAISSAEIEYGEANELINYADKISVSSPAFLTIRYHQNRLLIEQGNLEQARKNLDWIFKNYQRPIPVSARNSLSSQKMLTAVDLDEFLEFAVRKATAFSENASYDYTEIIKREEGYQYNRDILAWRDRQMFDNDAAEILNNQMPLEMLIMAGENTKLPQYLQKSVLISAWTRAVLLEDDSAQKRVTKLLLDVAPEMSNELNAVYEDQNDLSTYYLILKYPVMRPLVESGYGRFTISSNSLDAWGDNWWSNDHLTSENEYTDDPLTPLFLSEKQVKRARIEHQRIVQKGFAANILGAKAVSIAKEYPNAKQLPEMLHKTVRAIRYGDSSGAGEYGKEAFQILHKRYPTNYWTKKTPYWFSGRY